MKTIRQKLTFRTSLTLVVLFAAITAVFFMVSEQAYRARLKDTRGRIEQDLTAKGLLLVSNSAFLLRVYVEDNSISTVRDMVRKTVNENRDIVYGGYIRLEDFQPWVWVTPEDPSGIIEGKQRMVTESTRWALSLDQAGSRLLAEQNLFEFASPVMLPEFGSNEIKAGAILFGFSTLAMERDLLIAEQTYRGEIKRQLFALTLLALLAMALGFILTRRQAEKITKPIEQLTLAAHTLAGGEYGREVSVSSNDEIQELASAFNTMAHDMQRTLSDLTTKNVEVNRARNELSELNRDLEAIVEKRTLQLSESENKFRTLFNESADAILVADFEHIIDGNLAMLRMVGCTDKEAFLSLKLIDLFPERQPDGRRSVRAIKSVYDRAITQGSQHLEWTMSRQDGSQFVAEVVVTSFPLDDQMVLHGVFRDISERKRTELALKNAQDRLLKAAHSAGMAEIATGVLHNIGNIINSVNISAQRLDTTLGSIKIQSLIKANQLLQSHRGNLADYLANDEKGRVWIDYFDRLVSMLSHDIEVVGDEVKDLSHKIAVMRDVIYTQQNYAKSGLYTENTSIQELVEDAVKLQWGSLRLQEVEVVREYSTAPRGNVARVKLVHVITNLIKNAREAMRDNPVDGRPKKLVIGIESAPDGLVEVLITDTGCGIEPEDLARIFHHGYTTKQDGHGFGLHTCANFMSEMGGELLAVSDGKGCGATFIMRFPLAEPQDVGTPT